MAFAFPRSLTIDHTKCGAAPSSNFPVLVSGSNAVLADVAHGGHVNSSTGADILFFSDAALTTQIASEIDFYDNINGVLVAWVKVATVSNTVDTVFYVAYGNASPPARTTNPWDDNYLFIYHLANGTVLSANDSTSNANNGTLQNIPTASAGQIDGGMTTVGASHQGVTTPSMNIGTAFTVEAWVKHSGNAPTTFERIFENIYSSGFYLGTNGGNLTWSFIVSGNFGLIGGSRVNGTWQHLAGVYDGVNARLYQNGVLVGGPVAMANPTIGSHAIGVGFSETGNANEWWDGSLDEARISIIDRPVDWILTEYNNQNAPGNIGTPGFLTWSAEIAASGGGRLALLGVGS